jgi:hypothetical protein
METVLHVSPVTELDATAYNFSESFTSQPSAAGFAFRPAAVPASSRNLKLVTEDT